MQQPPGPWWCRPAATRWSVPATPTQQNRTYIGFENGKTAGNPAHDPHGTMNPADLTDAPRGEEHQRSPPPATCRRGPGHRLRLPSATAAVAPAAERLRADDGYVPYEKRRARPASRPTPPHNRASTTKRSGHPRRSAARISTDLNPTRHEQRLAIWTNYLSQQRHASRPTASSICSGWPIRRGPACADTTGRRQSAAMESVSHGRRHDGRSDDLQRRDHRHVRSDDRRRSAPTISRPISAAKRTTCRHADGLDEMNLWKQEPANKASRLGWSTAGWTGGGAPPTATMYFNQPLNQTLGYLNKPFGTPSGRQPATPRATRSTRSPG